MHRLWRAFLRLFFRLLYNELAWAYDLVAWIVSLGRWQAWGRTAIPYLRGRRVLELGHGPGHLLVTMTERGLSPVGVDLSPHMGRLARRRLRRAGQAVSPVRAYAQGLPFCGECFDSVVATFPTEFILNPATLRETARVLRSPEPVKGQPAGRLIIVAWACLGERDPLSRFIGWLYQVTGQGDPLPGGGEAMLVEAGFVPRIVWEQVGRTEVMLIMAEKR
ncbi:MAG: methyltransferase domain-containing protein [Chloroflexota bacterium]|nr:methyltransferase domain-containing protein [Chloroflexota bacterium]